MNLIIGLSVITASIAFTLTETKLFKPFREWVAERNLFLGNLIQCGYCTGHWVAFALTAIYKPLLFNEKTFLNYLLTAFIIAWLAAFQWVLMCLLMKKAGK